MTANETRAAPSGAVLSFLWLNGERAARLALGFVQASLVARHLGPGAFGQLNGALALVALLGGFAALGLGGVVARRITLQPSRAGELLGTALALRVVAGGLVMAFLGVWLLYSVMPASTRAVTAVISLTLVAQSLLTGESWFAAIGDQKPVASIRVVVQLAGFIVRVALVLAGCGVMAFAVLATFEVVANGAAVFRWARSRARAALTIDWTSLGGELMRESWPVMLSTTAVAVCNRLDLVVVSHYLPGQVAGSYAAAVRLNELFQFVAAAVPAATLGALTRLHARDRNRFLQLHGALAALAAWAGIVLTVAWTIMAGPAIGLVFGDGFVEGPRYLRVLAWTNISVFAGSVWSVFWLAERLLTTLMVITVTSASATVALNAFLLPRFGAIGSAWAAIVGQFLPFVLLQMCRRPREASAEMFGAFVNPLESFRQVKAWLMAARHEQEGVK